MKKRPLNAPAAPIPKGGYAQAVEVTAAKRWLFVSGQIPVGRDGHVPKDFASQARLAWANVEAQVVAAGMTLDNIVKATVFLSDRRYSVENRSIRQEVMADREIALTVVITGIFDAAWLLEIEAIAAA